MHLIFIVRFQTENPRGVCGYCYSNQIYHENVNNKKTATLPIMNFTVYIFKIFRICKKQIAFFSQRIRSKT